MWLRPLSHNPIVGEGKIPAVMKSENDCRQVAMF
jgi:hypothetical protein